MHILFTLTLTLFLIAQAKAATIAKQPDGKTLVTNHLLAWKIPRGWNVSSPNDNDIELKNKTTTISLFISKGAPANVLDLEQTRMKLDKNRAPTREHWNGETWLVALSERKDQASGAIQATTFATAQRNGNLFSALALTPRDHPDPDIQKVLSAIELK